MNICRSFVFWAASFLIILTSSLQAHAAPLASGSFPNDDSFFSYSFTTSSTLSFNFFTTSYASGGFDPVLTLFNNMTGKPIGFAGDGTSDASLIALLSPGSYILYLTEFPNVANGNLSDGFLFTGSPTITGDTCGVSGGKFLDTSTTACRQRTANYAVSFTASAVTPEPSSWVLMLTAMLALGFTAKRFVSVPAN